MDSEFNLTSDHGDLCGEKGVLGHSHLTHDGLIHVPLITYRLNNIAHQATNPVQHIDIMKTLISKAGVSNTQFQDCDLQTSRRDIAITQHLSASVDDDTAKNYEGILQYDPEFDVSDFHKSLLTSARTPDFKPE
ncbi:sulfatase-like hydrolase/transferase [Haloquadratum walsbyi]|uniref:sulfatase-like hydrolase/transferase n=1 Tax=Haloquadratum walsbyi TaxID=293091 RepID=UPI0000DA070F|nr:sulfatase-like hydrolase/transferase [Haloquadratum walsbyi]